MTGLLLLLLLLLLLGLSKDSSRSRSRSRSRRLVTSSLPVPRMAPLRGSAIGGGVAGDVERDGHRGGVQVVVADVVLGDARRPVLPESECR